MTYAYIIYGILVNREDLLFCEKEDYDWTDYISERYRIYKPKGLYSDNIKAFDKYSKDKFNLLSKLNVRIEPCGNRKEFNYILGIHDSLFIANDYEIIEEKYLKIDKTWEDLLRKFSKDCSIPYTEPKWFLASYQES